MSIEYSYRHVLVSEQRPRIRCEGNQFCYCVGPFPYPAKKHTDDSVAGGGIGGIVASVSFRQQDRATGYIPGLWTTVAAQLVICIVASLLMLYFRSQNKKADRGEKILEGHLGELFP